MNPEAERSIGRYDLVTPMIPIKDEILAGVERLLDTGNYILGEETRTLEKEMATACEAADAVGVASGSAALYLALQLTGVAPGVEVVTTPYTFLATIEAIIRLGGTPVFADIKADDLNLDPAAAAAAVTDRTRVILPVHIFGAACDMDALQAVADDNGLDIVEDMCQAFGSLYHGRPCGSFGRMSCLSFYPTKNLPGIGDGGMVICRDKEDAEMIRRLRGHDTVMLGDRLLSGWNSRLDEIQAMALRIRLSRFQAEQADRDRAAAIYDGLIPEANRLALRPDAGMRHTYHQYWIRVPERDKLLARLREAGVSYGVYYDPPIHRHELGRYCRTAGELTEAERAGREVVALPIHQALADADAAFIGGMVRDFLAAGG